MTTSLCPVCNLQLEESNICPACKIDFGKIQDIKNDAEYHHKKAVAAFEKGCFHDMFFHAHRSFAIFSTVESARLFGCAAILINKFDLGFLMWKKVNFYEKSVS